MDASLNKRKKQQCEPSTDQHLFTTFMYKFY